MSKYLHIVCLDAPSPADYGGAIDMMNRIKAFYKNGIRIHLHYFKYNERCASKELKSLCESVTAYQRKNIKECISLNTPYIVSSRCNQELISNINQDNHPVLLEGLHTTGIIHQIQEQGRKICVRMHNNEAVYYKELARCTSNLIKKTYFITESVLAKKYTTTLPESCMYACVSTYDVATLKDAGVANAILIPTFPCWQNINCPTGIGNYCLFHGNLSVPENEKAALWLLCNVFTKVRVPFIIAGKQPSNRLQKAAGLCQHTCLISNPTDEEMNDLVNKAHINVFPYFSKNITGIKLKLLHALYEGRHCVATPALIAGTGLEAACHIGSTSNAVASIISQLYYQPFEEEEIQLRKRLLGDTYDNDKNIQQFINYLW